MSDIAIDAENLFEFHRLKIILQFACTEALAKYFSAKQCHWIYMKSKWSTVLRSLINSLIIKLFEDKTIIYISFTRTHNHLYALCF